MLYAVSVLRLYSNRSISETKRELCAVLGSAPSGPGNTAARKPISRPEGQDGGAHIEDGHAFIPPGRYHPFVLPACISVCAG